MAYTERESKEAASVFQGIERTAGAILDAVRDDSVWDGENGRWDSRPAERNLRKLIVEATDYPFAGSWRGRFLLATRLGMDYEEMYPDIVTLADDRETSTRELQKITDRGFEDVYQPNRSASMFAKLTSIAHSRDRLTSPRAVWSSDYSDSEHSSPLGFQ